MLKVLSKFSLVFIFNLSISLPLSAKLVEKNDINFPIDTAALLKGETHYFFAMISSRSLSNEFQHAADLDTLALSKQKKIKLVLTKSVMLLDKQVGLFDDKQLSDEKFLAHLLGEQQLKKLGPASYKITVPGEKNLSYKMNLFFDADDVSTLPNSKVMRAVNATKRLDVISQSASNIMFVEKTEYTKFSDGGVSVSAFVPMKENKTLIITYNLWAIQAPFAKAKELKANFLLETEAIKNQINSFKP